MTRSIQSLLIFFRRSREVGGGGERGVEGEFRGRGSRKSDFVDLVNYTINSREYWLTENSPDQGLTLKKVLHCYIFYSYIFTDFTERLRQ